VNLLLPKMTEPDVLKALKNDPATAGIAVVAFTGPSQKNADSSGARWGLRISGQSGTRIGQRLRGVAGGAGAHPTELELEVAGGLVK
jgi:CheY-like chemotaxis protein